MTTEQLAQEIAALHLKVDALLDAIGPRITREQLALRRGVHRNTIAALIDRSIIPRPDTSGRFLLREVLAFEDMERSQSRTT